MLLKIPHTINVVMICAGCVHFFSFCSYPQRFCLHSLCFARFRLATSNSPQSPAIARAFPVRSYFHAADVSYGPGECAHTPSGVSEGQLSSFKPVCAYANPPNKTILTMPRAYLPSLLPFRIRLYSAAPRNSLHFQLFHAIPRSPSHYFPRFPAIPRS